MEHVDHVFLQRLRHRAHDSQSAVWIYRDSQTYGIRTVAYPPVLPSDIRHAEQSLGFALPALLRDIYVHVGNGNFGPGYGLLPLDQKTLLNDDDTLVSTYQTFRRFGTWPTHMLVVYDWGCGRYSCLDCTQPLPPVLRFWPDMSGEGEDTFDVEASFLQAWFQDWLDDKTTF